MQKSQFTNCPITYGGTTKDQHGNSIAFSSGGNMYAVIENHTNDNCRCIIRGDDNKFHSEFVFVNKNKDKTSIVFHPNKQSIFLSVGTNIRRYTLDGREMTKEYQRDVKQIDFMAAIRVESSDYLIAFVGINVLVFIITSELTRINLFSIDLDHDKNSDTVVDGAMFSPDKKYFVFWDYDASHNQSSINLMNVCDLFGRSIKVGAVELTNKMIRSISVRDRIIHGINFDVSSTKMIVECEHNLKWKESDRPEESHVSIKDFVLIDV